ncbi:MAG: hypothetical protein JWM05_2274, partial [Acidimicrobiales bacterium]|nr:hypothetical protein [Acidimicrobiales bacterium]
MSAQLSVCTFTADPPAQVAAALALLRPVADEIVVAVDSRVDVGALGPLHAVADRVVRAEWQAPLEANLAWLHGLCTGRWVLRLDGDEIPSAALVALLGTGGWDVDVTHLYVPRRWLWGDPTTILDQAPWWPDPQLRLIRNVPGIATFPTGVHAPPQVAGWARFLDTPIYHLDLLTTDVAERTA